MWGTTVAGGITVFFFLHDMSIISTWASGYISMMRNSKYPHTGEE